MHWWWLNMQSGRFWHALVVVEHAVGQVLACIGGG